jgi:hypothetical protein
VSAGGRWLAIPGYVGHYEVSDLGVVRSLDRFITIRKRSGNPYPYRKRGCVLKAFLHNGYWTVNLCLDGKSNFIAVHLLVMLAHVGPRPKGQEVRHGRGGKLDNRLTNLCYGTAAENTHDMFRDRTIGRAGQQAVKLTAEIVAECRRRFAAGETRGHLAKEFGVSRQTIYYAVTGLSWASVTDPPPVGLGRTYASSFRGVTWDRERGKWQASFTVRGRTQYLGRHATEVDAALAYDAAARQALGEAARLNFAEVAA